MDQHSSKEFAAADAVSATDDMDIQQRRPDEVTPDVDRKMRIKIDAVVLPLMIVISTLQFLDKVHRYPRAAD